MTDDDRKAAAEAALDLLVYAPIGFALEARSLLPKMVERGRGQVTMAKMVGQFAVQHGQGEAARRLGPVQEQVETLLSDLGLVTKPSAAPVPDDSESATSNQGTDPVAAATSAAEEPTEPAEPAEPPPAVASLAIPDYDSLAASQVVPRLRALDVEELEAVRRYEAAGRGRKTILNRISQLQGA